MRKVDLAKYEEKRLAILKAAERCFARDGFQGSTIANICSEADISPGHLYHYFASKEAIVAAIFEMGLKRAATHFNGMADNVNAIDLLTARFDQVEGDRRSSDQSQMLDLLTEARRNQAMAVLVREHSRLGKQVLAQFLRRAQARGQVDSALDPELVALILISVADGSATMSIRDPAANKAETMKLWKTLITRFLTPPTEA